MRIPSDDVLENLGQAVPDVGLDPHRGDQEAQLFDRRPLVHRLERQRQGHPELDLLDDQAQFARYRLGQILRRHLERAQHRVARLERGLEQIDKVGQLLAEQREPLLALSAQVDHRQRGGCDTAQQRAGDAQPVTETIVPATSSAGIASNIGTVA